MAAFLLVAVPAASAKAPAAVVAKPSVTWVKVLRTPTGVVVRVLARHAPLGAPAPGAQATGTVTVVLTRFAGDRNHAIAAGTAAWALPVTADPIDAVYEVALTPRQAAKVEAVDTLHALVLVDERVRAAGRAPARDGNFREEDERIVDAAPRPVAAPYLRGGGRSAVIDADARGRQFVVAVTLGPTLVFAPHAAVHPDGTPTPLVGAGIPAGMTLAISPTGKRRGTLVWPAFQPEGGDPVAAGSALLSPP